MAPGKRWMDFDYNAYGDHSKGWGTGFGLDDIQAAQDQGYTGQQIRILAQRAEARGLGYGQKARDKVDSIIAPGSMPWDYGLVGGAEFGRADLDMALGQGADYNTIKGYTDYARQYGIGVGQEAENWLVRQEDRERSDQRWDAERAQAQELAQQARDNAAANALQISQATAAQTAKMEEMSTRSRRVTSNTPTNSPLSSSGAGSFRARGLEDSKNKRGGGTSQFRASNPYFTATLNTGSGKKTTAKSTLNI